MFDIRSFRIGTFFGIPVEVNATWLIIFAIITFTLATSYFPSALTAAHVASKLIPVWQYALVAVVTSVLFFASILAHELCHSLVAKSQGGHVDKITLFIFGGVAQIDEEPDTPTREFLMAAAGPAMSLVLAAVGFGLYLLVVGRQAPWWLWAPLQYLALINLLVAVFNLLPGFPLDGGRVLRSILWGVTHDLLKATLWAVRVGQLIGWSMVVLAVATLINGNPGFLWFGLIGWFVAALAGQSYRQQLVRSKIEGVRASDIMTPEPEYVDGAETLDTLVNEHLLGRRHSRYPVIHEGSIVGVVTLPDVKAIDRADWPFARTIDVTNRDMPGLVVDAAAPAYSVLARLASDQPGLLLVVENGHLVGVLTRADVIHLLEAKAAS